jgi:hypothetical protein
MNGMVRILTHNLPIILITTKLGGYKKRAKREHRGAVLGVFGNFREKMREKNVQKGRENR